MKHKAEDVKQDSSGSEGQEQSILEMFEINAMRTGLQHSANLLNGNGESFENIRILLGLIDHSVEFFGANQDDSGNELSYIRYHNALISISNIFYLRNPLLQEQYAAVFLENNTDLVNEYESSIEAVVPSEEEWLSMSGVQQYFMRKDHYGGDGDGEGA